MKYFFFGLVFLITSICSAQIGGDNTYEFLNLPSSAHIASLGGTVIALPNSDLSFVSNNPALLTNEMQNHISINYIDYFTDINYAFVSYAFKNKIPGNFAVGIQYLNYGDFIEASENGIITGSFSAAEYAFNFSYALCIDSVFRVGATIKPVFSKLESYFSYGLLADFGATYNNKPSEFMASIVIKNIGTQIKPYTEKNYEPVPFEIQMGVSKKLLHAPFRFSLIAKNIEKYDLSYSEINNAEPTNFISTKESPESYGDDFIENIFRHFIIGVEFIPTNNFYVALGMNYKRRKELMISDKPGFAGISYGFGFRISKFKISYGRASYHLAGATNNFSIRANISEFI